MPSNISSSPAPASRWLTVAQAAEYLGVSERTIKRWIWNGQLKPSKPAVTTASAISSLPILMTLWRSRERVSSRSTRRTEAHDATTLFLNVTALSQTDLNPSASPTRPAEIVEGGAGTVPDENVDHAGSAVIYGRSDSTLNRGGVRMGTSEFYRVVEAIPEVVDSLVIDTSGATNPAGELLCFVVLAPDVRLDEIEPKLRQALRAELSPRHVPDRFIAIDEVPRTLNGKKCEVPVKKILTGTTPEQAVSQDALRNPDALKPFLGLGAS